MGQPITLYGQDGRVITVYGNAQREEELKRGALTENPFADAAPLADDFPAAALLRAGGYVNAESLNAAADDDLLAVQGIGEVTLKEIRAAQKAAMPKAQPEKAATLEDKIMKGKVK